MLMSVICIGRLREGVEAGLGYRVRPPLSNSKKVGV